MKHSKLVSLISHALKEENQDGLHIVIEDGNAEDHHIKWCRDQYEGTTDRGKKIATELLKLGLRERGRVLGMAWRRAHLGENE